jgi:hypothetical protein
VVGDECVALRDDVQQSHKPAIEPAQRVNLRLTAVSAAADDIVPMPGWLEIDLMVRIVSIQHPYKRTTLVRLNPNF